MVQIRDFAIDRGELSEYFMLIPNKNLMILFDWSSMLIDASMKLHILISNATDVEQFKEEELILNF